MCVSASALASNASTSCFGASGGQHVPLHVEVGGRQQFAELIALTPGLRLLDLVDQRLRDRLAGLVVHRIVLQHIGIERPVLVELRRESPPSRARCWRPRAWDICRSPNRPCSAWPNSWNIVVTSSKLIRARLPGGGLGEVRDVVDDRLGARADATAARSCSSTRRPPCCRA